MADTKISDFTVATEITAVDTLPIVQNSLNKKATFGQVKTYVSAPIVNVIAGTAVPLTSDVVSISGECTIAAGMINGKEIKFITTGPGKLSAVGLLPADGFTFTAENVLSVIWLNGKWNVLYQIGMTAGIV